MVCRFVLLWRERDGRGERQDQDFRDRKWWSFAGSPKRNVEVWILILCLLFRRCVDSFDIAVWTLGCALLCIRLVLRSSAWTVEYHRNVLLARVQG